MLAEMENLQSQIQQAKHATEINHLTAENLKREVSAGFYLTASFLGGGMALLGTLVCRALDELPPSENKTIY